MPSHPARLLCVGNGVVHLQTRCAVLVSAGYIAKSTPVLEAETVLQSEDFDLVIVSAWLSERQNDKILAAAGKTPTLMLTELVHAEELLAEVERQLRSAAQR